MKKHTFLTLLLVAMSAGALAEWIPFGGDGKSFNAHVDPSSIRKSSNIVKMWTMSDFVTPQGVAGKAYFSKKEHFEFDCTNEKIRLLSSVKYELHSGLGKTIDFDNDSTSTIPAVPGSVAEAFMHVACGKIKLNK